MRFVFLVCFFIFSSRVFAQYSDGTTGLLHTPSAEMQPVGTVILGAGFLNKELIPNSNSLAWPYHTYNYYVNVTFLSCLELSYICTLFKRSVGDLPRKWRGQDRHLAFRLRVLKEGQFWKYMPAVVLGTSDPVTGFQSPGEEGNGHFNKYYVAATKHIQTRGGELGVHLSYLYSARKTYRLNGPALGISYDFAVLKGFRLIAEYDAKDFYVGFHYRVIRPLMLQAMLQDGQYFSGGFTFLIPLKL